MSPTMFLGRVVLPALGLVLAATLTWHSVRNVTATPTDVPGQRPVRAASARVPGRITAEGRVVAYPGAEVTVGTEVLGTIINMPVREKAAVHKGDLLVELRADEVMASLREAHYRLTEAEVGLRLEQARSRLDRILTPRHGQGSDAVGLAPRVPHGGPGPPRRRQGGRRAPRGRGGQVPHPRADRRRGHCRATSTPARRSTPPPPSSRSST